MENDRKDDGKKRYFDKAYELKTTDETRRHYADWAEVYDLEVGEEKGYRQPARCAAALKAAGLALDAPILDVGCGTGLSGKALRAAGFSHVDGCDLSQGMLEKAFKTEIYSKLFMADLNKPPLDAPDSAYGGIAAVGVFSFGHVQPDAMDEFIRVSQPGAPIVIGLNEHFYREGSLTAKLDALTAAGRIERLGETEGEHIPGIGMIGWVIAVRRL